MKQKQIFFILLFIVASLCSVDLHAKEVLSNRAICLKPGTEAILTCDLGNRVSDKSKVYWSSSDPTVATLIEPTKGSVKIQALTLGQCTVTLYIERRPISKCRVIVDEDGVVRILAIGNSFSEDAIEQNLYEILQAEGISAVIGNMYIGGCSLETHLNNANADAPNYSYRKVIDGVKTTKEGTKISEILKDENWDFVTMQQASHFSGINNTYIRDLPALYDYVKATNPRKDTKYAMHQTWAYSNDSQHDGFRNYGNSQQNMYNHIVDANNEAAELVGIDIVIPAGTAIQNARTSFVGDNMNRDGYHLDLILGRYTAACTWADELLGIDILTNPYAPEILTNDEVLVGRMAAHNAVVSPSQVTPIK